MMIISYFRNHLVQEGFNISHKTWFKFIDYYRGSGVEVYKALEQVLFSEFECLDDAGELCGDVCASLGSASVADFSDHDEVA